MHVIGPELGLTQPGMTIVCGDSHTSTHGAFGALAFGIGTSEVEHVLATQCLVQKRPKTMRISYSGELGDGRHRQGPDPGDDRPARDRRHGRPRGRVRGRDDPRADDGEPDDDLQHDDRGRRPGGDDRPGRDHLRVDRGPPGRARRLRRRGRGAGASCPTDEGASFDAEVEIDAASLSPMVTWGTTPGQVVEVTGAVPEPDDGDRGAGAALHGSRARPRDAGDRARPGVHRLLHELADRRPARGGRDRRGPHGRRHGRARWSSRARRRSRRRPRPRGSTRSSAPPASTGAAPAARCAWG